MNEMNLRARFLSRLSEVEYNDKLGSALVERRRRAFHQVNGDVVMSLTAQSG